MKGKGFVPPWRYRLAQRATVMFQRVAVMWLFAPASFCVQRYVPGGTPGLQAKLHACTPISPSQALELPWERVLVLC